MMSGQIISSMEHANSMLCTFHYFTFYQLFGFFSLQQATLAVAEAERKKRERKRKGSIGSRGKHSFTRKSTLGIQLLQGG